MPISASKRLFVPQFATSQSRAFIYFSIDDGAEQLGAMSSSRDAAVVPPGSSGAVGRRVANEQAGRRSVDHNDGRHDALPRHITPPTATKSHWIDYFSPSGR